MNSTYTTHLICAPQLEEMTTIGALLAVPGNRVEIDTPLLQLQSGKQILEVCAPETGIVGDYTVTLNETVESGDLLLTMEIEEKPFGFLPMLEEEPAFSPAIKAVVFLDTEPETFAPKASSASLISSRPRVNVPVIT